MALKHMNVMYFSFFLEQCGLRTRNTCGLETEPLFSWLCLQITNLTITDTQVSRVCTMSPHRCTCVLLSWVIAVKCVYCIVSLLGDDCGYLYVAGFPSISMLVHMRTLPTDTHTT